LEEVKVWGDLSDDEQVAALERLRHLPRLRSLSRTIHWRVEADAVPAFIPRSLKTLRIEVVAVAVLESVLRALPSLLQASGAGLEEIEVKLGDLAADLSAEGGAALARILRTCSPTLKEVGIPSESGDVIGPAASEVASGLVSCCEGLECLELPWSVFRRLPPTCPAFPRLTRVSLGEQRRAMDFKSPVWDLVASGRLPALTELYLYSMKPMVWGHVKGKGQRGCRLMRALEGVAGTLRRLELVEESPAPVYMPDEVSYELGAAVGKLKRLTLLSLGISMDGRA
jgi:hypothetical protein